MTSTKPNLAREVNFLQQAHQITEDARRGALMDIVSVAFGVSFVVLLITLTFPALAPAIAPKAVSMANLGWLATICLGIALLLRFTGTRFVSMAAHAFTVGGFSVAMLGAFGTGYGLRAPAVLMLLPVLLFAVFHHGMKRSNLVLLLSLMLAAIISIAEFSRWIPGGSQSHQPQAYVTAFGLIVCALLCHRLYVRYAVRFEQLSDVLQQQNRALSLTLQRLERSLAAKRDFTRTLSHGTRTPLAGIQFGLQLLEREPLKNEVRQRTSLALRRNAHRLRMMTLQLDMATKIRDRALSCSTRMDSAAWDVWRSDCLAFFRHEAAARNVALCIEPDTASGACVVHTDAALLKQLASILIDNALRHQDRGEIRVRLILQADGMLQLAVIDEGPGIDASDAERLFSPFLQMSVGVEDFASDGLGLGLSLIRAHCDRVGGYYGFRPGESRGSVFWIAIPAMRTDPSSAGVAP